MADPFSTIAGAIGLAGGVVKLSKAIIDFISSIQGAPRTVKALSAKIASITETLNTLESFLQELDNRRFPDLSQMTKIIQLPLQNCEDVLQDVKKELGPFVKSEGDPGTPKWKSIKFAYWEKDILSLERLLSSCEVSLTTALTAINLLSTTNQLRAIQRRMISASGHNWHSLADSSFLGSTASVSDCGFVMKKFLLDMNQIDRGSLLSDLNNANPAISTQPSKELFLTPLSSDLIEGSQYIKAEPNPDKPQPLRAPSGENVSNVDIHRAEHERFCTTGEHKTPYTTFWAFANHEIEHDSEYIFLPNSPVDFTLWVKQCALCDLRDLREPSEEHLEKFHSTVRFYGRQRRPMTRSWKGDLEELLRKYKTPEQNIGSLTVKWRKFARRQAYSCGFCVNVFKTLSERVSHIDRGHFYKGQRMEEWSEINVIKGLLLQPDIRDEYLKYFGMDPSLADSVSWPLRSVGDLRIRLELKKESAIDLAREVYYHSIHRPLIKF